MVQFEFCTLDIKKRIALVVQDKERNFRLDGTILTIIEHYKILKTRIVI